MERCYLGLLGEGVMLTPELAGCVSTVMTEEHVDGLLAAAERTLRDAA
jgi:glutamate-1-semialdehyde aminotransferase